MGDSWKKLLKEMTFLLIPLITLPICNTFNQYYKEHCANPYMSCQIQEEQDTFSVKENFLSISIALRPQLLVCYHDSVLFILHLEQYYQSEFLQLPSVPDSDLHMGSAPKTNQESGAKLQDYLYTAILDELSTSYSPDVVEEIQSDLTIFVSIFGVVQYQNISETKTNTYCIVEENGILHDFHPKSKVVKYRLCDETIRLGEYLFLIDLDQNEQIRWIVEQAAEEIRRMQKT